MSTDAGIFILALKTEGKFSEVESGTQQPNPQQAGQLPPQQQPQGQAGEDLLLRKEVDEEDLLLRKEVESNREGVQKLLDQVPYLSSPPPMFQGLYTPYRAAREHFDKCDTKGGGTGRELREAQKQLKEATEKLVAVAPCIEWFKADGSALEMALGAKYLPENLEELQKGLAEAKSNFEACFSKPDSGPQLSGFWRRFGPGNKTSPGVRGAEGRLPSGKNREEPTW
jgi:hypothetical protein